MELGARKGSLCPAPSARASQHLSLRSPGAAGLPRHSLRGMDAAEGGGPGGSVNGPALCRDLFCFLVTWKNAAAGG